MNEESLKEQIEQVLQLNSLSEVKRQFFEALVEGIE